MRPCSACVSSFSREVVFPPCQSVCCIRVFYIFPQSCFLNCFFFSHKFRVFESFPGTFGSGFRNDILSAFFRTPPSRERERERERERGRHEDSLENAVRRALETFSGALFSFVAFDHPLGLVFSKDFFCLLSSFDSFFSNRDSGIQNDCVSDSKLCLFFLASYKTTTTTERRKSSTST